MNVLYATTCTRLEKKDEKKKNNGLHLHQKIIFWRLATFTCIGLLLRVLDCFYVYTYVYWIAFTCIGLLLRVHSPLCPFKPSNFFLRSNTTFDVTLHTPHARTLDKYMHTTHVTTTRVQDFEQPGGRLKCGHFFFMF